MDNRNWLLGIFHGFEELLLELAQQGSLSALKLKHYQSLEPILNTLRLLSQASMQ